MLAARTWSGAAKRVGPWLTRRGFHLLPSQELSLLAEHITALPPPQLATDSTHAAQIVERLRGRRARITADIQDADPSSGHFVRLVDPSLAMASIGLKGASHLAENPAMAAQIVSKILQDKKSKFQSASPPFSAKRADRVILSDVGTSQSTSVRLQVLLLADRKGHPHPSRPGMHYGPTLTLSALPSSIPIAQARWSFPDQTSLTCIDVSRIPSMSSLESSDPADASEALQKTAQAAAEEAVNRLEGDLAVELNAEQQRQLKETLQQLFVLYWKSDGERFTLQLELSASGSLHVRGHSLSFDDYTTGVSGRQKLLTALRYDGSKLYKAGMSLPAIAAPSEASAIFHSLSALEAEAETEGLIYRTHRHGNIGLFGYGAGMGMGTLDGVIAAGGAPSNFFDGGGGATRANAKAAMKVISQDPTVRAVFVNIFGGITRSDQVALGIVDAWSEFGLKEQGMPLIVRFKGNKADEARRTLAESGLKVTLVEHLRQGAREAIAASASNSRRSHSSPASAAIRHFSTSSRSSSLNARHFSSAAARRSKQPFTFVTGYAFAGKPRESEQPAPKQDSTSAESEQAALAQQIGFPPDTEIGKWRDELLQCGDAGEDALACADMGKGSVIQASSDDDGDVVLAVADGVGGWTESGVDPSLFSQALMYHVTQQAAKYKACPERISPGEESSSASAHPFPGLPDSLLDYAYNAVQKEEMVIAGSATACVITLDSSKGVLRSANLGDSGFLILRQGTASSDGASKDSARAQKEPASHVKTSRSAPRPQEGVLYASTALQYGFNTPFQLAKLPPSMFQEGSITNTPKDAALWECNLRDGDIVLLGTDGLFDNVHTTEVVQLMRFIKEKHHAAWNASKKGDGASFAVNGGKHRPDDPLAEERSFIQLFCYNLIEYTRMCQFSQTKRSPFEAEAERYGITYPGGKVDDVAVVCSLVVER